MEQNFEFIGVVKSYWLQMNQNIQRLRTVVCRINKFSTTSAVLVPQFVGFSCSTGKHNAKPTECFDEFVNAVCMCRVVMSSGKIRVSTVPLIGSSHMNLQ